jgi:hypothetical protein
LEELAMVTSDLGLHLEALAMRLLVHRQLADQHHHLLAIDLSFLDRLEVTRLEALVLAACRHQAEDCLQLQE